MNTAVKRFTAIAILLSGVAWLISAYHGDPAGREAQSLVRSGAPMLTALADRQPVMGAAPVAPAPPAVNAPGAGVGSPGDQDAASEWRPLTPAEPTRAPADLGIEPPAGGRTLRMLVTAYCPCRRCCGRHSDGRTASGHRITANGGRFVAADTNVLPFGTRISVPGYHGGATVEVLDRGGRIRGRRLDVFFPSHATARQWGSRWLDVTVYD